MLCRFDDFTLDLASGDLRRGVDAIELQPMVARFLTLLAARPGEVVPRDEVVQALWPDVQVTDQSLRQVVHKARLALGDDPRSPRIIGTLARRGFRFLAGVRAPTPEGSWPVEADGFVGRRAELAQLSTLAETSRVISLCGAAGAGKTRLLVHWGATAPASPGGAWFCDLAEARDPTGLAVAVAVGLGVDLGREEPIVQLGRAIAARGRCVVALDNCEQATAIVCAAVESWLAAAPEATFVLTSRERVGLGVELAVEPLAPADAVALFEARARAQSRDFSLTAENRADVEALVDELDRLPLCIELAAARIRVLGPGDARARLHQRLQLLANAGDSGRHATLRAAIDASWALLSPWEQAALAQCSAFVGPFSLGAAEAVVDLSPWPEAPWLVDVIHALIRHNLLRSASDAPRFSMLASLHAYAAEALERTGAEAAQRRHGAYCASPAATDLMLPDRIAACERAVARRDAPIAVATCQAAWSSLELHGPFAAGVALADRVLTLELQDGPRAAIAHVAGRSRHLCGRMAEAWAHYEAASSLARAADDRRGEGAVLEHQAISLAEQGRVSEALATFEAALAAHVEVGERRAEGRVRGSIGLCHEELGRADLARDAITEALALHREVGDRRSEGFALGNLGMVHLVLGSVEVAASYAEAALAVDREVGDRRFEAMASTTLGAARLAQGRHDEARALLVDAISASRELGNRRQEGIARGLLGEVYVETGDLVAAEAELTSALATHRAVRNRRYEAAVSASLARLEQRAGAITTR